MQPIKEGSLFQHQFDGNSASKNNFEMTSPTKVLKEEILKWDDDDNDDCEVLDEAHERKELQGSLNKSQAFNRMSNMSGTSALEAGPSPEDAPFPITLKKLDNTVKEEEEEEGELLR